MVSQVSSTSVQRVEDALEIANLGVVAIKRSGFWLDLTVNGKAVWLRMPHFWGLPFTLLDENGRKLRARLIASPRRTLPTLVVDGAAYHLGSDVPEETWLALNAVWLLPALGFTLTGVLRLIPWVRANPEVNALAPIIVIGAVVGKVLQNEQRRLSYARPFARVFATLAAMIVVVLLALFARSQAHAQAALTARDAAERWLRSVPPTSPVTIESASWVTGITEAGESARPRMRVSARQGNEEIDAWLTTPAERADWYFHVSALSAAVSAADVRELWFHEGFTLIRIGAQTLLCRDGIPACAVLPTERRISALLCGGDHCWYGVDRADGLSEHFTVTHDARGARRRSLGTCATEARVLRGPSLCRERRGPFAPLETVPRPSAVDDQALRPSVPAWRDGACVPVVRSLRDAGFQTRVVSCDPGYHQDRRPVRLDVEIGNRRVVLPLFEPGIGLPEILRAFDVSGFTTGFGFLVEQSDGGSPSGMSVRHLAVLTFTSPPALHLLALERVDTEGIGASSEGYEVDVSRLRLTTTPASAVGLTITRCEHWIGSHFRGSDRWTGRHALRTVDVPVRFDEATGFSFERTEHARYAYAASCDARDDD